VGKFDGDFQSISLRNDPSGVKITREEIIVPPGSVRFSGNSKGVTLIEGVKWDAVGKINNFIPIIRHVTETVQDRTSVVIITNRKSRAHFRLVPESPTLDDFDWSLTLRTQPAEKAYQQQADEIIQLIHIN